MFKMLLAVTGLLLLLFTGIGITSCTESDDRDHDDDVTADDDNDTAHDDDDTEEDDDDDDDSGPYYDPTWAVPTDVLDPIRGRRVIRGIIHAHSIYSHDACDEEPEGNTECLMQMRRALCTTRQNYLMLTDHDDSFADNEFPDVLLHLPEMGDELLLDAHDRPVANVLRCENDSKVTIMAGTENHIMPIHLHQHPGGTVQDRYELYGRSDPAVVPILRDLGASVAVNHPEGWSIQSLIELAPDAVEIFNLHAAIDPDLREQLGLQGLDFLDELMAFLTDPLKPEPNLAIMTFFPITRAWTDRWDALLQVRRCYTVSATDVHRNALPFNLSDGERADGYRRMMQFFSNHALVDDETPQSLEQAVDSGRHYSAFEFLGFPMGFDFYAQDAKGTYEMGQEPELSQDLTIHVKLPRPFHIDPQGPQPEIAIWLIRIDQSGSQIVAVSDTDLEYAVQSPAVFRAEVHIVPHHLEPFLGSNPGKYIHDYPWIYANPIYVRSSR